MNNAYYLHDDIPLVFALTLLSDWHIYNVEFLFEIYVFINSY